MRGGLCLQVPTLAVDVFFLALAGVNRMAGSSCEEPMPDTLLTSSTGMLRMLPVFIDEAS